MSAQIVLIDRFLVHRSGRDHCHKVLQTLLRNVFRAINSTSVWTGHLSLVVLKSGLIANDTLHQSCLIEAVLLSKVGNGILPLAGIIAMGVTPALLVVTRGRIDPCDRFGSAYLPFFQVH